MGIAPGLILACSIPLLFLFVIRRFDFYQSGQFGTIRVSLVLGGVVYLPAALTNIVLEYSGVIDPEIVRRFVAPFVEEILKALVLIYLIRSLHFTYVVDGALYGFATGVGFAIVENFEYIFDPSTAIAVALQRVFSANLVHAFSSAAIGIALGVFWLRTSRLRWLVLGSGFILAIGQHMVFNNLTRMNQFYPAATFIPGAPGLFFIYLVMQRGKKQAQGWIKQKLGMDDRVTPGEVAAIDRLASTDEVLFPILERFGAETASQVEKLLYLEARLGIKRKALESIQNNRTMHLAMEVEMHRIRAEIEETRHAIGTYPMLFVRGLFTEEMVSVWDQMQAKIQERSAAKGVQKGGGLWSSLEERVKQSKEKERF